VSDPTGTDDVGGESRIQRLKQAVEANGVADVSVRDLLEWFGSRRRGTRVVERVVAGLQSAGLRVGNAVASAGIDDSIRFHAAADADVLPAVVQLPSGGGDAATDRVRDDATSDGKRQPVRRSGTDRRGCMLEDFLRAAGASAADTESHSDRLIREVRTAASWLEVGPELRRATIVQLGVSTPPMSWTQFEFVTAEVYDWSDRGPLWYRSPIRLQVGDTSIVGTVVFCRDGWWAPDWQVSPPTAYLFQSWDEWMSHQFEMIDTPSGNKEPRLILRQRDGAVTLMPVAGDSADSAVAAFALGSAVLDGIWPVVAESRGQEYLHHPPIELWTVQRLQSVLGPAGTSEADASGDKE
jgi:hypothetical protein